MGKKPSFKGQQAVEVVSRTMKEVELTFSRTSGRGMGVGVGGLLAGKPKPTSCPLPAPFSSPSSPLTTDASSGARLHHLHARLRAGRKHSACLFRPGTLLLRQHRVHGAPDAVLSLNATWNGWSPCPGASGYQNGEGKGPQLPHAHPGVSGNPSCASAPGGPRPRAWKSQGNPKVCEWELR